MAVFYIMKLMGRSRKLLWLLSKWNLLTLLKMSSKNLFQKVPGPLQSNPHMISLPMYFDADDSADKTTLEGSYLEEKQEETPGLIESNLEGAPRDSNEEEDVHQISQKLENRDQKTAVEWSTTTAEEQVEPAYVPGQLFSELEDALSRQRYRTALELREEQRSRTRSKVTYRSQQIQNLPAFSEEQVRQTTLIEQHCLKLLSVQQKVRSDIVQELRLKEQCVGPDTQLYDWGLMRIRRSGTSHLGHGETGELSLAVSFSFVFFCFSCLCISSSCFLSAFLSFS